MQGKALWYVGPGRAELREEEIAAPRSGEESPDRLKEATRAAIPT